MVMCNASKIKGSGRRRWGFLVHNSTLTEILRYDIGISLHIESGLLLRTRKMDEEISDPEVTWQNSPNTRIFPMSISSWVILLYTSSSKMQNGGEWG